MIKITQANFLALIQDNGRKARHLGFTAGGAMDKSSYQIANHLLDNPKDAAVIEVTYGAFALEAIDPIWVSIAGADLDCQLNHTNILPWQSVFLNAGDILRFVKPAQGLRAYVGVKGGLETARFQGSRSSVVRENLPGLCGRALKRGDVLKVGKSNQKRSDLRSRYLATEEMPDFEFESVIEIPFHPSYQWEQFDARVQQQFLDMEYQIQESANRMGYRLSGESLSYTGGRLVSEGIQVGSIQIPPDGQPIILMRDHPTIGGYPKMGVVTEAGLNTLAQMAPGKVLKFIPHANSDEAH